MTLSGRLCLIASTSPLGKLGDFLLTENEGRLIYLVPVECLGYALRSGAAVLDGLF